MKKEDAKQVIDLYCLLISLDAVLLILAEVAEEKNRPEIATGIRKLFTTDDNSMDNLLN